MKRKGLISLSLVLVVIMLSGCEGELMRRVRVDPSIIDWGQVVGSFLANPLVLLTMLSVTSVALGLVWLCVILRSV